MSDYKVKFTAEDNLTGTLNKVSKELQTVGNSGSKLDNIAERFDRLQNSTAPLRRRLRELQNLMSQMNLDGLNDTDIFTQMAAKAGEYQDAIGDAAQATRLLSSDTANLDAGIEAIQGLAGAASIATGVMGLLGTKNENVEQAILKVQGAIGVLNGVQAIANTLNKDSILMLKLKQIVTNANTVSTTGNTIATGANTVATGANTLAVRAWNIAKAIGKALLGDFTGLLIVGAGALATYAIATSDSTDAEEDHQKQLKKSKDAVDVYTNTLQSSFANLMTSYSQLKSQWQSLSSEHQKSQWITDNRNKLEDLGISVDGVNSVENAFTKNTNAVVQGFVARAKAAAYLAKLTENYKKQIELIDQINTAKADPSKRKAVGGQEITDENDKNSKLGYVDRDGKWRYKDTIVKTNAKLLQQERQLRDLQVEEKKNIKGIIEANKSIPTVKSSSVKTNTNKGGNIKHNKTTHKPIKTEKIDKKEPTFNAEANTLQQMQDNVSVLENKLKGLNINSTQFKEVSKEIESWKDKIVDVNKEFEKNSVADLRNQLKTIEESLSNENLTLEARIKLVNKANDLQKQIDNLDVETKIKANISFNDDVKSILEKKIPSIGLKFNFDQKSGKDAIRSQFEDLVNQYDNLAQKIQDGKKNKLIDESSIIEAENQLKNLEGTIDGVGEKVRNSMKFDAIMESLSGMADISNFFDNIGNSFEHAENSLQYFSAALNAVIGIMQTYQTIQSVINTLSTIFGATQATTAAGVAAVTTAEATKATADSASITTATSATVALKAQEAAYLDLAAAAYFAAHAAIPFAGLGIASGMVSGMMAAMAAQTAASHALAAFAEGGIVGGNSFVGDKNIVRVNSGEMILNGKQQRNLFNLLDEGGAVGGGSMQTVSFKLRGADIYGSLKNYKGIKGKVNKNI